MGEDRGRARRTKDARTPSFRERRQHGVGWPADVTSGSPRQTRPAAAVVVRVRPRRRLHGHDASCGGMRMTGRCGDRMCPAAAARGRTQQGDRTRPAAGKEGTRPASAEQGGRPRRDEDGRPRGDPAGRGGATAAAEQGRPAAGGLCAAGSNMRVAAGTAVAVAGQGRPAARGGDSHAAGRSGEIARGRPRGKKVCGRLRRSEDGQPRGGIAHGRP